METQIESRLAQLRNARGIAAADLAKRVGVSRQTIYAIEAGTYVPNTEVSLRMARELEVTVEDIFSLAAAETQNSAVLTTEYLSSEDAEKGKAVRTCKVRTKWVSVPVSASPYHLPEADGVVSEAARADKKTKVAIFSRDEADEKRLVVAGCDPAASLLARMVEKIGGVEIVHAPASSQRALRWLKDGVVHIAGSHLEDAETGEFNLPFIRRQFPRQETRIITFAEWEEGLVVAHGNPKKIRSVGDLVRKNVRFVNRETGSGSRGLLEKLLHKADLPTQKVNGYDRIALGHLAAAYCVMSGDVDCCLATQSAARTYGLDFIPLHRERYDFVLLRETFELPAVQVFLDVLQRAVLRRKLETLAGYDTSRTGALVA